MSSCKSVCVNFVITVGDIIIGYCWLVIGNTVPLKKNELSWMNKGTVLGYRSNPNVSKAQPDFNTQNTKWWPANCVLEQLPKIRKNFEKARKFASIFKILDAFSKFHLQALSGSRPHRSKRGFLLA